MELARLIRELSRPSAFPEPPGTIEVIQTHASVVFRTDTHVYKIKKPVDLGFLDYSTLDKRHHYCCREVALNRRLAPDVYLGVVPVVERGEALKLGASGTPVEWAVRMVRLPDEARLVSWVERGALSEEDVVSLARRLAEFHEGADRGPEISAFGRFPVVKSNCLDNFDAMSKIVDVLSPDLVQRLATLTASELERRRGQIEDRALRGVPCDTHGDLRLDHVYLFPDRLPPGDLLIIDCIEFSDKFRYADPVADIAFLVMDLQAEGQWVLADLMVASYLDRAGEGSAASLFPLYVAYRASVRAKVEALKSLEAEVQDEDRLRTVQSARRHLLIAIGALSPPLERPCLVLVAGLPGTGKSVLARDLQANAGFSIVRSDVVRKAMAGLGPRTASASDLGSGIYTRAWSDRTYAECLRLAEAELSMGGRVVVDANFKEASRRRSFLGLARTMGVPARIVVCEADERIVRARLRERHGDASDADVRVYEAAREAWEELGPDERPWVFRVDTGRSPFEVEADVRQRLRAAGLS